MIEVEISRRSAINVDYNSTRNMDIELPDTRIIHSHDDVSWIDILNKPFNGIDTTLLSVVSSNLQVKQDSTNILIINCGNSTTVL